MNTIVRKESSDNLLFYDHFSALAKQALKLL